MPTIKKSYYQINTPAGGLPTFTKHAYQLLTNKINPLVLVHYIGDESVAVDFPHGNSKDSDSKYVRTMPSVLKHIESRCDKEKPSVIYRSEVTKSSPISHMSTLQPRNIKQVENIRHKVIQEKRITYDSLYNLAEIAADMPDFVHSLHIHPDLVCVVGQKALLNEFDRVLLLRSPSPQLLSYDTTFQLGDFYLSSLCFRHTLFQNSPVIPAMFLLHERKFQDHHSEFFAICKKLVPSLENTKHPFVTDEERSIVNSISNVLPNVPQLRCWNHIFRDIRRWLRAHGAPSNDVAIYLEHVRDLFHLQSQSEYSEALAAKKSVWSAPFYDYYTYNIQPDIASIARWSIAQFEGVYDSYSGVTTNQAESLNTVLKNLQQWNESPHDCMVLALYYLQAYYKREIMRGIHGMGNYPLHPQFKHVSSGVPLVEETVYTPDEIVQRIKASGDLKLPYQEIKNSSDFQATTKKPTSVTERAQHVIAEKKISFDVGLKTFIILGSGNKPQAVKLFPKPTCTCPSTVSCYHILAAKLCIGMENSDHETKLPYNMAQLKKNSRAGTEKRSGRKRPRVCDLDVQPAPDARQEQEDLRFVHI